MRKRLFREVFMTYSATQGACPIRLLRINRDTASKNERVTNAVREEAVPRSNLRDEIHYRQRHALPDQTNLFIGSVDHPFGRNNWIEQGIITMAIKVMKGFIPLSTTDFYFFGEDIDWDKNFDDPEDGFTLNRFHFLKTLAFATLLTHNKEFYQKGVSLINDWLDSSKDIKNPKWESYSVSERIINWGNFINLKNRLGFLNDIDTSHILESIRLHVDYLRGHLEYHEYTNNHIINNGRALFIYGSLFDNGNMPSSNLELSYSILNQELRRQFYTSGFHREDSTYYHFLMAKTYFESYRIDQMGYKLFSEQDIILIKNIIERCFFFFRPDGSVPLIGDMCPDNDMDCLKRIARLARSYLFDQIEDNGFDDLWMYWYRTGNGTEKTAKTDDFLRHKYETSGYIDLEAGWLKLTVKDSVLFSHWNPSGHVPLYSHGHWDVFGIDLYLNGTPILVDPGNYHYRNDRWMEYFKGARGHNIVSIDGVEPYPRYYTAFMSDSYVSRDAKIIDCKIDGSNPYFVAYHDGYNRLTNPVECKRIVSLHEGLCEITDRLEGSGNHQIELHFQFHPGLKVNYCSDGLFRYTSNNGSKGEIVIQNDVNLSYHIYFGEDRGGWFSPEYGKLVPAPQLVIRYNGRLPFQNTVKIVSLDISK